MLEKYFVYECEECERGWCLDAFAVHKIDGFCIKDSEAPNHAATIRFNAQ